MSKGTRYFWNLLIAIDQFINTVFGGDPDETISSRLGKWERAGKNKKGLRKFIYTCTHPIVELFEADHYKKSIEDDEGENEIWK